MKSQSAVKKLVCGLLLSTALALGSGLNMSCDQSFSASVESSTHDSDIRKLSFVFRNHQGVEVPIQAQQIVDGLPINNELLPLWYARYTEPLQQEAIFTKPFEIRNRNKASFNVKFNKGPATPGAPENFPLVVPWEPQTPIIVQDDNELSADYGLTTAGLTATTTPAGLIMPPDLGPVACTYLTNVKVTINESLVAAGLTGLIAKIIDPAFGDLLVNIDLMAVPTTEFETPVNFSIPCGGQQLSWTIEAVGANLDTMTAGEFELLFTFEDRTPPNTRTVVYTQFNTQPSNSKTLEPWTSIIPSGATVVRIVANVHAAFVGDIGQTFTLTPKYNGTQMVPAIDVASIGITDSGVISIPVANNALTQLTCDSSDALNLLTGGIVSFDLYWTMPTADIPFAWSLGDQMHIVAFASLDDIEYVPISVARHDFSNTPFVDIIKFEPYNIPDDFDPWYDQPNLPVGMPPGIPWLGNVGVQNSMMLFLTEFDNASTWNYLRFLIVWIPATEDDEEISTNDDVAIEITANAREL